MKQYNIIYADPPWQCRMSGGYDGRSGERHYTTMTIDDIAGLPVSDLAAKDAVLFLWTTHFALADALRVMTAWGFEYKTLAFNWVKKTKHGKLAFGIGTWTRSGSELCLLGVRGNIKRDSGSVREVIVTPLQRHSAKPPEVRERIVELMGDLPRIELFAREKAEGWDVWGDETPSTRQTLL